MTENRMHVLYVTTTFPPDNGWGGIGTYVYHMARAMASQGHCVTVLCGVGDREYESSNGGVTVVRRIGTDRLGGDALREQIADLLCQIADERGVHVVECGEYAAEGVMFQRRRPGFPVVVRLHGASMLCVSGDDPTWKRLARHLIPNALLRHTDACERESIARAHVVTSCAQWLLETYRQRGWRLPGECRSILNPIGEPTDTPRGLCSDYRQQRILFLGRLSRRKGADLIPGVAARVLREVPEAQFVVVGQDCRHSGRGSWGDWIKSRLPARYRAKVVLEGGVPHAQVCEMVREHSLAFFASTWEAMPYSHLECMQAGIACVVASGGGATELGEHGVALIKTGRRADEIGNWLVRLLRDPEMRKRIGTAARQRVAEGFAPSRIAQEMGSTYSRAVELAKVTKT